MHTFEQYSDVFGVNYCYYSSGNSFKAEFVLYYQVVWSTSIYGVYHKDIPQENFQYKIYSTPTLAQTHNTNNIAQLPAERWQQAFILFHPKGRHSFKFKRKLAHECDWRLGVFYVLC